MLSSLADVQQQLEQNFGASGLKFEELRYLFLGNKPERDMIAGYMKDTIEGMFEDSRQGRERTVRIWQEDHAYVPHIKVGSGREPEYIPVESYDVCVIDVGEKDWQIQLGHAAEAYFSDVLGKERFGFVDLIRSVMHDAAKVRENGHLFVPIFHNAHQYVYEREDGVRVKEWPRIAHHAFDDITPGILTLNKNAFRGRVAANYSKLNCFNSVMLKETFF